MNQPFESDPLDALRAADPVDADHLSSASLARIRARVSEELMTTPPRRFRIASLARLGGLAAGASIGALALVLLVGPFGPDPGVAPVPSPGTGSAACVESYSPVALANRTFAFDGTVMAIDGERVTFAVALAFRGVSDGTITLRAPGMTDNAVTSVGGPSLAVGERYLVAGDEQFVWGCGFTQPYDPAIAAQWSAALAG